MLDEGKFETFRGHTVVMLFVIQARLVLLGYQVAAFYKYIFNNINNFIMTKGFVESLIFDGVRNP